ncbi:TPA: amidohydrolase [Photobacterium damselae]
MNLMKVKKTSLAVALSFVSAGAFAQGSSLQDVISATALSPETTIYTAKDIVTMDGNKQSAQAVAVVNHKIVAVGSLEEVKAKVGDKNVTVNNQFKDKIIVPGLIDQHLHPLLSSLTMTAEIISMEDWVLPTGTVKAVSNREDYLKRLAEADKKLTDPNELLLTWGFHHYFHGKLTKDDLDKINNKRPIIVWHRSAHEFILNTAALKKYGVTADYIAKQSKSSQEQLNLPEGHFWEQGMFVLLPKIAPAIATPKRLKDGLEFTEQYLHTNGITTSAEPGGLVSKQLQEAQNAVLSDAQTPFRFYFIPDGKTMALEHLNDNMIGATEEMLSWGEGNTAFLPKQVKLFADGAIFSQLMQMKDGYLDGHEGEWMIEPEIFAKAFTQYWDAGYQIHIHQNGDKGLDMVLKSLKENMKRNPRKDHRTTIVHFGFSTPEQVKELKELGAIVSANPYYTVALADKYSEAGVGPERSNEMVRLGDVAKEGISISLHSDMPMAPSQPLYLMWSAVNRTTFSGRVAGPDQRISAEQALKAVTIDAAYSLQLENQVGSIEPGKLANFTILDENPLTIDPAKIKDIKIWGTVLEGRIQPIKLEQKSVPQANVSGDFVDMHKLTPDQSYKVVMESVRSSKHQQHTHTSACSHDNPLGYAVVSLWQEQMNTL